MTQLNFQSDHSGAFLSGQMILGSETNSTNGSDPFINISTTPGSITFAPGPAVIHEPVCQWILYEDIAQTR